jgi:hypothetical protein
MSRNLGNLMTDDPEKQGIAGRDNAGRFVPGVSGNPAGRPRGVDFRKLVMEFRKAALDGDLQEVYDAMLTRAKAGDVNAAKLLLDRLCDESSGPDVTEASRLRADLDQIDRMEGRRAD